ncbi:hypothetical protein VSA01S_14970 [Vibrio sagamiensis NBRC 104589]|uniref:Uncharacterized protein n=1 Tax=Vibrio sagamiensis NBRC 104589 TaxID=1219064 RepID=A0A511QDK3_9VIBR|nr:hypothetical protein VSA01S_14970 [Vibrio sagamiensis NBRC 104589]
MVKFIESIMVMKLASIVEIDDKYISSVNWNWDALHRHLVSLISLRLLIFKWPTSENSKVSN